MKQSALVLTKVSGKGHKDIAFDSTIYQLKSRKEIQIQVYISADRISVEVKLRD